MGEYIDFNIRYGVAEDEPDYVVMEEDGLTVEIPLKELNDLLAGRIDTLRVNV